MGSCTGKNHLDTRELTTKEKLTLKKIEEANRRAEELNAHSVAEYKANQSILKAVKNKNQGTKEGFGAQTENAEGQRIVLQTNKAMTENRFKKKKPKESVMECAQDIDLEAIFNTIHNVKVQDAEFEDVEALPGTSSYVPVPKNSGDKTIKKGYQFKEEEEIAEEIDEDLEEYYDEEFEAYEEPKEPSSAKKVVIKQQKEDIASYFENELGVADPQKKTMVQQALKPLSESTYGHVIKTKEKECIELVGEKRFKELRVRMMDGKINLVTVMKDTKFTP